MGCDRLAEDIERAYETWTGFIGVEALHEVYACDTQDRLALESYRCLVDWLPRVSNRRGHNAMLCGHRM